MAGFSSCKKDEVNTSPDVRLSFSTDSVHFDTLFATVGSATRSFMIYNNEDEYVNISRIRLANDPNNSFRINVDGLSGTEMNDVEIGPKDSLFVFVEVTVEPNANALYPFVEGEVQFTTNGNDQSVKLVAWGWDAIFYVPTEFPTNGLPDFSFVDGIGEIDASVTWTADRPVVVYGYVVIDSTQTLTIEPGTQVFFHSGSGLWAYRYGQLIAEGTRENPIIFQGDRLESFYDEQPGQWDRIWVNDAPSGVDHIFRNVLIKNNFIGIQAESDPFTVSPNPGERSPNKLVLENVVIRNNSIASVFAKNFEVEAQNFLGSSAGQYVLAGTGSGSYRFEHATFANNWRFSTRQTPSVFLTNVAPLDANTVGIGSIQDSHFLNCIIHGNGFNELGFDMDDDQPGISIDLEFKNCLIRGEEEELKPYVGVYLLDTNYVGNDPGFVDFAGGDFRLAADAFSIGKGSNFANLPDSDIIGTPYNNPRPLGCFEFLK